MHFIRILINLFFRLFGLSQFVILLFNFVHEISIALYKIKQLIQSTLCGNVELSIFHSNKCIVYDLKKFFKLVIFCNIVSVRDFYRYSLSCLLPFFCLEWSQICSLFTYIFTYNHLLIAVSLTSFKIWNRYSLSLHQSV